MLFVNIFLTRLKYLEDDKHENYFIVSIVGHMKNGVPVGKSKDYLRSRTVYDEQ